MAIDVERVRVPDDRDRLVEFLTADEWPFHGRRTLSADDVDATDFSSSRVHSFWVRDREAGDVVGLLRLFDLDDIGLGAPRFDVRIAGPHRHRGYGTQATRWLVEHLFDAHPDAHRLEADTRSDNTAMQRTLIAAGFALEGRLRSSWPAGDGTWFDTLVYGILRSDRSD